jgi:tripartite ATP-independent transporter DctP family solute receptor
MMSARCIAVLLGAFMLCALAACRQETDTAAGGASGPDIARLEPPKPGLEKGRKLTLRAADVHPEQYPTVQGLLEMKRYLEEKSGGQFTLDVHHGGTLGGEKETIEQTIRGDLDINRISAAPVAEFSPRIGIFSLPYLFTDRQHMWTVLDGEIGQEILESIQSSGIIGLCYYDAGARSFYTRERLIETPGDLKGLTIRVMQNEVVVAGVEAMGASATPLSWTEVYTSLQTGHIDGAENNPPTLSESLQYEVAKFYSLTEHTRIPEVVIVSRKTWETLSAGEQKLLREAAQASVPVERKRWAQYEEKAMANLKKQGVSITEPNQEPFRAAVAPVYRKYASEYGDLIERIRAAGAS